MLETEKVDDRQDDLIRNAPAFIRHADNRADCSALLC